ncbi:hypothetical protein ABPG75_012177 [Micractinium tetrahymenae]
MALVSLIDDDRLFFKSFAGSETASGNRIHSFCDASLRAPNPTMMVVPDTLEDARFQESQFVKGPPHVCFYAGAPLISSDGYVMGSLGVLDIKPRSFPAEMCQIICNFSELVVREMERDQAAAAKTQQLEAAVAARQRTVRHLSCFEEAVVLCDVSGKDWPILYVNDQWCEATGTSEPSCLHNGVWTLFQPATVGSMPQCLLAERAIDARQPFALLVTANSLGSPYPAYTMPTGKPPASGPSCRSMEGSAASGLTRSGATGSSSGGAPSSSASSDALGPSKGLGLPTQLLSLEFRPATNDFLSDKVPGIAIPSFVEAGGGESADLIPEGFYFAIIRYRQGLGSQAGSEADTQGSASSQSGRGPRTPSGASTPLNTHAHLPPSEADESATTSDFARSGSQDASSTGSPRWEPVSYGMECPEVLTEVKLGPLLGTGAYGKVFRGKWRAANVAVKILDAWVPVGSDVADDRERGPVLEAVLSKDLQHPNLVATYEYAIKREQVADPLAGGLEHQQVWIIQQLCTRGTLIDAVDRGWLRQRRSLDAPPNMRAVILTAQDIAAALSFMHSHGVLHGDLAPGNVLLACAPDDPRKFMAKAS